MAGVRPAEPLLEYKTITENQKNMTRVLTGLNRRQFLHTGLAAGAGAGLATTALGRSAFAATSVEGGTLRGQLFADISNLDPAYWTSASDSLVMACLFVPAFEFDPASDAFTPQPLAFKSYEIVDDTHVAFELNQGIMYSGDYGEMTAEDVKFSFERIANPDNDSPYQGDWAQLDHVEVTGKYTGTIVLKAPFAPLFTSTLPAPSGMILPEAALKAAGGKFTTEPPVTNGPYRIKEWTPRTRLVLERNPDFTLYEPAFDVLELTPIEDNKTAELGFEAGDLDYAQSAISSIPRYEKTPPKDGHFIFSTGLNYNWLGINQDNEALTDQRVRRALQHAISRETVVEAAFLGAAKASAGIIAPGLIGHREKNLYNYDPEKARALLDEAGVSGLSLTMSIQQTAEDLAAAQVIQALLADVGVTLEINQYESGTFWSLGVEADGDSWKDVQLFLLSFTMQPDPSWATAWFTSDQVGVWNWQRFSNEEYDTLNANAQIELDSDKRDEMYVKMQDLMEESGDFIFLNFEPVGSLVRNSVDEALRPDGIPQFEHFAKA